MKVTDLSIGDWLSLRKTGKSYQVTELDETFVTLGNVYGCYYKEVEPIPLTAEILEKNGFEKFVDAFHGFGYVYRGINMNVHVYFFDMNVHVYFFDKQMDIEVLYKDDSLSMSTLDVYVHTLQHALRLCGIDKEIEL